MELENKEAGGNLSKTLKNKLSNDIKVSITKCNTVNDIMARVP